jgi:hypothetical protein
MTSLLITVIAIVLFGIVITAAIMYVDSDEITAAGMGPAAASSLMNVMEAAEQFRAARGHYPLSIADLTSEYDIQARGLGDADFVISEGVACLSMPYDVEVNRMLEAASERIDGAVVTDECGESGVTGRRFLAVSMDGVGTPVAMAYSGVPASIDPWEGYAAPTSGRCIQRTAGWESLGQATPLPPELVRNEKYYSPNGQYHVIFQNDGNVVTYSRIAATGAASTAATVTVVDGLLTVRDAAGNPLKTWGRSAENARMVMGNDGVLRTIAGECYNVLFASIGNYDRLADYDVGQRANGFAYGPTVLKQGESVYSPNEAYHAVLQSSDGNFVGYRTSDNGVLFSSGKLQKGSYGWRMALEPNGLKQYDPNGNAVYSTGRSGRRWGFSDGGRIVYLAPYSMEGGTSFLTEGLLDFESLISPDGRYILSTNPQFGHNDNRLAIYTNDRAQTRVWESTKANSNRGFGMKVSIENGTFVQRDTTGAIVWSFGTNAARIGLTNEGRLEVRNASGGLVFTSAGPGGGTFYQ